MQTIRTLRKKVHDGTSLRELVAAGALANARQCGGHDYVGWHTFMALVPAFEMAKEMPEQHRALPVLKVLYRNAQTMQRQGGHRNEMLKPIGPCRLPMHVWRAGDWTSKSCAVKWKRFMRR